MKTSYTPKEILLSAALIISVMFLSIAFVSGKRNDCMQALKAALRDPSSLEIDRGGIEESGKRVSIDYRARNGFGGMNSNTFYCEFDEKGELIDLDFSDWE